MGKIISIVIANYNYGRYLETAIRSVADQDGFDKCELIVVDGGSTDNSVEIVKKYADKIAWWCSEKDKGQSDAFNKGFSHARGKYLTWLNADDVLMPHCLSKILAVMERNPKCDWFTGNFFRFTEDGCVTKIGWGPNYYPKILQRPNSPIIVYGPTSFFSKKIYLQVGGINNSLHYIMDTDMWMRFIVAGIKQRRINCLCWGFRMHEASKTAEFGQHSVSDEIQRRIHYERACARRVAQYSDSSILRLAIRAWQIFDGSLLVSLWLQLTFRSFRVN